MSDKKSKAAWDDEPTPLCEKERWQPDDDKARSAKNAKENARFSTLKKKKQPKRREK